MSPVYHNKCGILKSLLPLHKALLLATGEDQTTTIAMIQAGWLANRFLQ